MAQNKEEAMREFILNCSELLFTERGYKNTSMDMIAEKCEISKPTLYNYFKSKYELFMDLYLRFQNEFLEKGRVLMAQNKDKEQIIGEIIDLSLTLIKEKCDFLKMMVREHHMVIHENYEEYIKLQLKKRHDNIISLGEFMKDIVRPEIVAEFGTEMIGMIMNDTIEDVFWNSILGDFCDYDKQKRLLMLLLKKGILA